MPNLPNVSSADLLLYLSAKKLNLNDGDSVSLWADQSGNGNDFTQTGDARPTKQTNAGKPYISCNGIDQFMSAGNVVNNLDSFAVFTVHQMFAQLIIGKASSESSGAQWFIDQGGGEFYVQDVDDNYIYRQNPDAALQESSYISCCELLNRVDINVYINGNSSNQGGLQISGTLGDYTSDFDLTVGKVYGSFGEYSGSVEIIYQITDIDNWATDRAAITAWLQAGEPDEEEEVIRTSMIGAGSHDLDFYIIEHPKKSKYKGLY